MGSSPAEPAVGATYVMKAIGPSDPTLHAPLHPMHGVPSVAEFTEPRTKRLSIQREFNSASKNPRAPSPMGVKMRVSMPTLVEGTNYIEGVNGIKIPISSRASFGVPPPPMQQQPEPRASSRASSRASMRLPNAAAAPAPAPAMVVGVGTGGALPPPPGAPPMGPLPSIPPPAGAPPSAPLPAIPGVAKASV
jgi:hypothetical protein